MIIDKLIRAIQYKSNPTCVGLDTRVEHIPQAMQKHYNLQQLQGCADAVFDYNRQLIDTLADHIPSVKIQNAYYEMYGVPGVETYVKTIEYAHQAGLIVIADVKRGDIGATSQAYAAAHLDPAIFNADFMTVNPYFGTDGMDPFLKACKEHDKGLFVLVKTSNPTSAELQDLILADGSKVYEKSADLVMNWGGDVGTYGYNAIGAVVGATHPQEGIALRQRMKNTFFLIPGYGAQGGTADDLSGMFVDGIGGIVNSSRGIIAAWAKADTDDFRRAALDATLRMKNDLQRVLG